MGPLVTLRRRHQAEVALLDEVHEVEAVAAVAAGDGDDEPQVRLHEPAAGGLVAVAGEAGEPDLLGAAEEG